MDTFLQSLLRGRMLAAVAGTAAAGLSGTAALTGAINDATAIVTAALALVSAVAALYSKLREIKQGRA